VVGDPKRKGQGTLRRRKIEVVGSRSGGQAWTGVPHVTWERRMESYRKGSGLEDMESAFQ